MVCSWLTNIYDVVSVCHYMPKGSMEECTDREVLYRIRRVGLGRILVILRSLA